jgi:hypothetical protein
LIIGKLRAEQKRDSSCCDQALLDWNTADREIRWVRLEGEQLSKIKEIFHRRLEAFGKAGPIPSRLRMLSTKLKKGRKRSSCHAKDIDGRKARIFAPLDVCFGCCWDIQAIVQQRMVITNERLVLKANGDYRPVGDYRLVNEQCEVDAGPMANVRQKMSTFAGCRYFAGF